MDTADFFTSPHNTRRLNICCCGDFAFAAVNKLASSAPVLSAMDRMRRDLSKVYCGLNGCNRFSRAFVRLPGISTGQFRGRTAGTAKAESGGISRTPKKKAAPAPSSQGAREQPFNNICQ